MRKYTNILAKIISWIFGPILEVPLIYLLILLHTGLSTAFIKALLPITVFLEIVLPVLSLGYFLKVKLISDADITKRHERPRYFGLVCFFYLLSLLLIALSGMGAFFWLKLTLLIILFTGMLLTFKWKVSVHITLNTITIILLCWLIDYRFWPLFMLLPLVGWARYVLKKHSFGQMLLALILSMLILIPLYFNL